MSKEPGKPAKYTAVVWTHFEVSKDEISLEAPFYKYIHGNGSAPHDVGHTEATGSASPSASAEQKVKQMGADTDKQSNT